MSLDASDLYGDFDSETITADLRAETAESLSLDSEAASLSVKHDAAKQRDSASSTPASEHRQSLRSRYQPQYKPARETAQLQDAAAAISRSPDDERDEPSPSPSSRRENGHHERRHHQQEQQRPASPPLPAAGPPLEPLFPSVLPAAALPHLSMPTNNPERVDDSSLSFLRLRNVTYSTSIETLLTVLQPHRPVTHYAHPSVDGRKTGEHFFSFSSPASASALLSLHRTRVNERPMEVYLSSKREERCAFRRSLGHDQARVRADSRVVLIRGVPFTFREDRVEEWLTSGGVRALEGGLHMPDDDKGRFCGDLLVELEDEQQVEAALSLSRSNMDNRTVEVLRVAEDEVLDRLSGRLGPFGWRDGRPAPPAARGAARLSSSSRPPSELRRPYDSSRPSSSHYRRRDDELPAEPLPPNTYSAPARLSRLPSYSSPALDGTECLTGDHRVLTSRGWQSISRVQVGDEVLSFNICTCAMEWKPVLALASHAVDPAKQADTLFRMQGSGMDVIATRNHRMLLARNSDPAVRTPVGYETVGELLGLKYRLSELSQLSSVPHSTARSVVRAGLNTQPGVKLTIPGLEHVCDWWWKEDEQLGFLTFLGCWLRDGWLEAWSGGVCISQKKEATRLRLEQLLSRVFPRWWRSNAKLSEPGTAAYTVLCPPLYKHLRLMAVGPLGYNPRDPLQLRSYPHFTCDEELAAKEQQSDYCVEDGNSGRLGAWTEHGMMAAFRAAERASDLQRCWRCRAAEREAGNELVLSSGEGCQRGGHLQCAGLTAVPEGDWLCPACSYAVEEEKLQPPTEEQDDDDSAQLPLAEGAEDPAVAQQMQAAGEAVWWKRGQRIIIDQQWFCLKRWLGGTDVVNVYSRLSTKQAVALLDGFCRADGAGQHVQYDDDSGEPTGQWSCLSSSFPLIDQLMLIGQLAGAAVDLALHTKAGKERPIDGPCAFSCDLWALRFSFTKAARSPMQTAPLARPVDVSDGVAGRGYYQYADDGRVWCISVKDNSNFLTQRLSLTRLPSGGLGVRALSVFTGNCLRMEGIPYDASERDIIAFFAPVGAAPIRIHRKERGGDAFLEFASVREAELALARRRAVMGTRWIDLVRVEYGEVAAVVGLPPRADGRRRSTDSEARGGGAWRAGGGEHDDSRPRRVDSEPLYGRERERERARSPMRRRHSPSRGSSSGYRSGGRDSERGYGGYSADYGDRGGGSYRITRDDEDDFRTR